MPSTQIQIVKWTFPAFALIIGLLWYKRRRVDRADPGGIPKSAYKDKIPDSDCVKVNGVSPKSPSLYEDSGILDDTFVINSHTSATEEAIASPRKISESLDIPVRKPASQPISMQSGRSSDGQSAWHKDADAMPTAMTDIQLGSNPKISNFEMVARNRSGSSFEAVKENGKVMKIFENVAEEEDLNPVTETQSKNKDNRDNSNQCTRKSNEQSSESTNKPVETSKTQAQVLSERDSANHSPVSGVLDGSVTDEARSEGSMDSGKGGSIKGHAKDNANSTQGKYYVYTIRVPQDLVGRLIGRQGSFLQSIRNKANVRITIQLHPTMREYKVCVIEGTMEGINIALDIIRQRFPEKTYPNVILEEVVPMKILEEIPWVTELMQLSLVEEVNNDVLICHILEPNRLFVQLPTHPTYPSLRILDDSMTQLYDLAESPAVPDELKSGMIVVVKWYGKWVRGLVENPDPEKERNLVRLVDHGGYWVFSHAEMRKIRSDYLNLPFQAIEIFIANIEPKDGEWKQEAYDIVACMCSGIVGQAQIEAYINTNMYVNLYVNVHKHGVVSLADELIARGYAEHVPLEGRTE